MKFNSTINVPFDVNLLQSLQAECADLHSKRARVEIVSAEGELRILIFANDFISFRAFENAAIKLLTIYFKMNGLENKL